VERQHQPQHERQVTHARQRLQMLTLREIRVSIFEQLPAKMTVFKQNDLIPLSCQLLKRRLGNEVRRQRKSTGGDGHAVNVFVFYMARINDDRRCLRLHRCGAVMFAMTLRVDAAL
jgi:hypothetical protein